MKGRGKFIINLKNREIELLILIQTYFDGAGRIGKERNSCCDYTVGSLDQIVKKYSDKSNTSFL